jgi:hypothetical protein
MAAIRLALAAISRGLRFPVRTGFAAGFLFEAAGFLFGVRFTAAGFFFGMLFLSIAARIYSAATQKSSGERVSPLSFRRRRLYI